MIIPSYLMLQVFTCYFHMTVHGFTFQGDTLEVYEELKCMTFLVNPEKLGHLDLLFSSMFFVCSLVGGLGFRACFFFLAGSATLNNHRLGIGDSYNGRFGPRRDGCSIKH